MKFAKISVEALREQLAKENGPGVLQLDLAPVFAAEHIPGSRQAGLYEMDFRAQVEKLGLDPAAPLVLYAADADNYAPRFAAEKLERDGYTDLRLLEGGLAAWVAAGYPVERGAPEAIEGAPAPSARPTDLTLATDESLVRWTGRNRSNLHTGSIGLREGSVALVDGRLDGGHLVFDMSAIECSDISDTKMNRVLLAHLANDDFFDVERYPTARVELSAVRFEEGVPAGRPNYRGTASLTLKDVTKAVPFALVGATTGEGFSLQGPVSFDRSEWNVLYGSARFFTRLGMHLVNDFVDLDLRLNFR